MNMGSIVERLCSDLDRKEPRYKCATLLFLLLEVPRVRRATIGDRTFHAAGSTLWNGLPSDVVDCQTVDTFRRRLKHFFFNVSFFLTLVLFFCV